MAKPLLRLLAVVLLGLVVPAQGMASVAAGQCMALGHHQDAGDGDHEHPHDGAHEHDNAAMQDDETADAHCGPCVACCGSFSIAAPVSILLIALPSSEPHLFSPFPPLAVQPQGLDRPPLAL
jgi:hypothetical protein